MIYAVYLIENLACLALIAFGVHGCAGGGDVYSLAVIAGMLFMNTAIRGKS